MPDMLCWLWCPGCAAAPLDGVGGAPAPLAEGVWGVPAMGVDGTIGWMLMEGLAEEEALPGPVGKAVSAATLYSAISSTVLVSSVFLSAMHDTSTRFVGNSFSFIS